MRLFQRVRFLSVSASPGHGASGRPALTPKSRRGRWYARVQALALAVALPGLVQLTALPAAAQAVRTTLEAPGSVAGSVTEPPVQQSGSAAGLPHLVDSAATRAAGVSPSQEKAKRPAGGLPLDERHKTSGEPAKGGLASPPPLPPELKPSPAPDAGKPAREAEKKASAKETTELAAALETARRTKSQVLVESATTENSQTFANSNGTLSTQVTASVSTDTYVETTVYQDGTYQLGSGHPSSSSLWVGTSANTYEIPTSYVRDRAFVRFNVSAVPAGATVTAAEMKLWNSSSNACSSVSVTASRVMSSWSSSIAWYDQPSADRSAISGTNVSPSSGSCGSSSPRAMKWDVTTMAAGWVSGTSGNYGVRLMGPEGTSSQTRTFASAESSTKPVLTLTYTPPNTAPTVAAPAAAPTVTGETGGVVTSLTPVLSAVLSDVDGGSLSGEFQVQVGSSLVWSGTASGVAAGGKATVAVPAGKLSDGQSIQYRARAYDGAAYSAWSDWQTARVTAMPLDTVSFQQFTPADNTQVGSLTPALSAYAQVPGEAATSYWYQVCAGPKDNWTWCESSTWVKGAWTIPAGKLQWGKTYWWYAQAATSAATATSSWRSFTAVPEQDSINALLAAGTDGREFNHVTGNYTHTETDLTVAAVGPPLSVVRTYNSLDPRTDGAFGAGWTTRWDTRLENEPLRSTVLITYPDGRQWRFAEKGDGTYASPAGTYATLATQSGGGWRLMDKESTSYWFDSAGRLVKVTDSRGRTQTLQYGTDGKLAKVIGAGGRSLTFTWSGGHVTGVASDAVDGAPITWSYAYDGDYLVKVCPPSSGGACVRYEYGDRSQYRSSVIDGRPVGYWRLNETGTGLGSTIGNAMKSISGVGDATIAGSTADATGGTPAPLDGSSDTAMTFKGATGSAYVSLPAGVINGLGGDTTIEAWFKTTGSGTILGYQNSATDAPSMYTPAIYVGTDGKLRGQLWTGTVAPITSATAVNDGNWHHVALSGARTTQTLYLDGQQVGTLAQQITNLGQWDARIGYGFASSSWPGTVTSSRPFPFAGSIDEVAVYGKPLRLEQILTHYRTRQVRYQLTKITKASGRVAAVNTYAADGGRLLTHTDANGGLWKLSSPAYTKDSTGATLATITVADPHNGTLTYVDDASRDDRLVSSADQLGKKTTFEYDTGGFVAKVTDPNGNVRQSVNDGRGNVLAKTVCRTAGSCGTEYRTYHVDGDDLFDPRNDQPIEIRDARSSGLADDTYLTRIEYDEHGDRIKLTGPPTPGFPSGRSASWTYTDGTEAAVGGGTTPGGLLKTQTDRKGNTTTFAYTSAGDLATATQPSGQVLKFTHDPIGRVTATTKISSAVPGGVTTSYGYDPVGRLVRTTGAGVRNEVTGVTHTSEQRTTYDADGNKLTEVWADLTGGDPDRTVTYTYDGYGRPETVTGAEGGVKRYAYDHKGRKTSYTDERGTVYHYAYTARDELASTTLAGWTGSPVAPTPAADVVVESLAYDPGGRLASRTDAMGRTTAFTYYADDRQAQKIAKGARLNGAATGADVVLEEDVYDAAGNLTRQTTDGGLTRVDAAYDAAGRLISKTLDPDKLGRTTTYAYDANDNISEISQTAAGAGRTEVTEFAYNELDKPVRKTVRNDGEDLVTTYAVDDRGLTVGITDPRGNASGATAADYTTTIRYDLAERAVEAAYPPVMVERGGGTPARTRPTAKMGYDTAGELTHVVDPEGRTSVAAYDRAGRLTSESRPAYTPPGGAAVTPAVKYGYDGAGQQVSVTDERGQVTTATYDGLGRRVRSTDPKVGAADPGQWTYTYDLAGELLSTTDPTGARTESTYDDLGRVITKTAVERRPAAGVYVTRLEYDTAGRVTRQIRPAGDVLTREYDAAGAVTAETDALGNTSTIAYDLAGRPAKATTPTGTSTVNEYDRAGRKVAVKQFASSGDLLRTQALGYDAAGNLISQTTPEGHTLRQAFDAGNRLVEVREPVSADETITTRFGYDAIGSRTRVTDGRGNATITTYNSLELVESVIEPSTTAHPNPADRTWTTIYDSAGNPVVEIAPGGVRVNRTFDELNRLTKQTGSGAEAATADKTFGYDLAGHLTSAGDLAFAYNDRGLLLKVTGQNGDLNAYGYDANGRLTQRLGASGTASFSWDGDDRLTQATDPVTGTTVSYGYDRASRLTSLGYGTGGASRTFSYDPLDRLIKDELKSGSGGQIAATEYGYDRDDNMVSKTTSGTAGAGANSYTYDWAGRLTSWTAPDGKTTDYGWDAAGNRIRAGDATYTYDERNRLLSGGGSTYTYTARGTLAEKNTGGRVSISKFDAFDRLVQDEDVQYGYDALDRMTTRVKGQDTGRFTYDGLTNNLLTVTGADGAAKAAFGRDALGNLLSVSDAGGPQMALTDLHGDLVGAFAAQGTSLAGSTAFDPFGQVVAQTGTTHDLGYQGGYTDQGSGKVNMATRWYQPGSGTFASRDTATLDPVPSVRANRYTYGDAAPLTTADPTGHSGVEVCLAGYACGGYVCSGDTCYMTDAAWNWWINYMYSPEYQATQPKFTDERAKELGVMPNGREAPKGYWDASKVRRDAYMTAYDPRLSYDELDLMWKIVKNVKISKDGTIDPEAFLPSGKSEAFMAKLKAAFSKKGWIEVREAFCKVITGQAGSCGMLETASKEIYQKFKYGLGKAAEIIMRTFVSLVGAGVEFSSDVQLRVVESKLLEWAKLKFGSPCTPASGLFVCGGLPKWMFPEGRIGYTIGRVFLTSLTMKEALSDDKRPLLHHEYRHAQQWYHYANKTGLWFTFAILYFLEGSDPCGNRFEEQAGWKDGGYPQC
ncbi:DNRLRE domain-containing protein [Microbispora sp. NPDC046933]|uniref:DNRLRE domain-containing protein n=1 Tax=Microbispora sp. NPDC046933 TaxID=3155618 RepID=UPI0033FBDE00